MRPRRILAAADATGIFDEAVRQKALAVVSLQGEDGWHTFKSRFLERDPRRRFFVLDYTAVNREPLPTLIPGQYTGVSFRHKSRKILFATAVEATGRYACDDHTTIPAVRYRWPDSLTELQRRVYYRTPVPETMRLVASIWPGGVTARTTAQGTPLQVTTGRLADISCGGALVVLNEITPPAWQDDATLGVELQLADDRPPVLINAHYRGSRHDPAGRLCVAIQFVGLEVSVDGRLVLQRLARWVQKLHRLGEPTRHPGEHPPRRA